MDWDQLGTEAWKTAQEILGYLNFSSGMPDPRFLGNLNQLFGRIEAQRAECAASGAGPAEAGPTWRTLGRLLQTGLGQLHGSSEAFRQIDQAEAVLRLVFDRTLTAYRRHHRDLLFHQTEEALFQPFLLGRVCEAVLRQAAPWEESDRIVHGALNLLNDFIGHRPVAVLQTEQKLQPYAHEWVRPIPLFIRGAGVAVGRYHELIEKALEILEATDPALLAQAWFNPQWLDELAMDPRAYDFDHPVHKRPNYHFGQWDPHQIDNAGRYRRSVLQEVTLDALMSRVEDCGPLAWEEALFEAAAVLAGTMLMGSGISGGGPGCHDSNTSLANLLPRIAEYRDTFYQWLLGRLSGPHAARLQAEAVALQQPFGGARQHLNQQLARRRAMQLQHVHLAQLFAWMGYTEAAVCQAEIVPVASARMSCQLQCRLTAAHQAIDQGRFEEAAGAIPEIEDLLERAIQCGALVDPWNILGFGGQFSLFPAVENSVHDYRVDELIELVGQIFALYTRLQKEAAAAGETELPARLQEGLEKLAQWWDKFATTEVSEVEGFSGRQAWESAAHVAEVLRAWHEAGTASGDLAFWRGHLQRFHSPKAYALVVQALLEKHDLVASMALLIQWLSQAGEIPLAEQGYSFHELAVRWMEDLLASDGAAGQPQAEHRVAAEQRWPLARKLLDYLEANADQYWHVPQWQQVAEPSAEDPGGGEASDADEPEQLFAAAYEDVTFRDSANDGFEGEMLQGGPSPTDYELAREAERIVQRLAFLTTLARLWKLAASALGTAAGASGDRDGVLAGWLTQATSNFRQLSQLLTAVDRHRVPSPRGTQESLVEYDRRRSIKEHLLEQVIATCVEAADAARSIRAAIGRHEPAAELAAWEEPAHRVLRAVFRGDPAGVRSAWPELLAALAEQPLLYVALAKGGSPQRIVASRSLQQVLRRLLAYLPRLGLLRETYRLIETIQEMERSHAVGPGAVTEFDRMFDIGCKGIVDCLAISSERWRRRRRAARPSAKPADMNLIGCLERAVEGLLQRWLDHSRRVRLSVLETVADENRWQTLKRFIETYGHDLFTQKFMNLGNLRAILHQGVDVYLGRLLEEPEAQTELRLLADLGGLLPREKAAGWLSVAIEAIAENYSEYVDYNSTTTQSDRGEMLYTLLDFLRLQASYDRVAWNLRPVILAHEVLVRRGRDRAAEIWRQAVAQRTAQIAEDHLERFARLSQQYGMRLPSVAERLEERFVRPLAIDRLRALIRPAMEELQSGAPTTSFAVLQREIAALAQEPSALGFDIPGWLEALEDEVAQVRSRDGEDDQLLDPQLPVAEVRLSLEDAQRQVREMLKRG